MDCLAGGGWVFGFHPVISRILDNVGDKCHRLNALPPSRHTEREALLRSILGGMGEGCVIHSPFRCDFGRNITIGDRATINFGMTVLDENRVEIGCRVFIGPNVSVYTVNHSLDPEQRARGIMRAAPVVISDDVWICGSVTILPGVTIGRGAVIGAGSVVTADIPPMTLAAGVPCRPLRQITDADRADESQILP